MFLESWIRRDHLYFKFILRTMPEVRKNYSLLQSAQVMVLVKYTDASQKKTMIL